MTSRDSGEYTCVVSNEYGSINYTFELEVVIQGKCLGPSGYHLSPPRPFQAHIAVIVFILSEIQCLSKQNQGLKSIVGIKCDFKIY